MKLPQMSRAQASGKLFFRTRSKGFFYIKLLINRIPQLPPDFLTAHWTANITDNALFINGHLCSHTKIADESTSLRVAVTQLIFFEHIFRLVL